MQRLSGVLVILAGAALGGYLVLPAPQIVGDKLGDLARLAAADRDTRTDVAKTSAVAAVAAPAPQTQPSIVPSVVPADAGDHGIRVFSPASPLTPVAPSAAASPAWTAVVTSEPSAPSKLKSSKPGDAETRAVLASDLQRELKRVGCYGGEVTGTWTPATKRAMAAFMERVNASLPAEEPDYILLTLVQGHAANACGAECPSGQVPSEAGRCVPKAVVAQAARRTQREEERRATEDRKAQQQEHLAQEQRAAEAKRFADARNAASAARFAAVSETATAPKIVHPKPQQTAAVEPEKLPWLAPERAYANQAEAVVRPQPIPGMMSVGGPSPSTADIPASMSVIPPVRGPRPAALPDPTGTLAAVEPPSDETPFLEEVPAPRPAKRPTQSKAAPYGPATIAGLPGTKAGPAAVAGLPGTKSGPAAVRPSIVGVQKYQPARLVRHPQPGIIYPPPKPYTYASNTGGKIRRGQPRPGTPHYNLMQSLGGIY
jgi:hypothetical protein